MPEVLPPVTFVALAFLGLAVARWWLVPVPLLLCAIYVAGAAAFGGVDRDGVPVWQLTLFWGGLIAGVAALGLSMGVVWGKWLRASGRREPPTGFP
jgi:hypothetical protein